MLSDADLDRHLSALKIPMAGRALVRKIRQQGPERELQGRMDCVRVRHISRKMGGRALYAESRTVEYPGIFTREHDPQTLEIWPQPCKIDLSLPWGKRGTRVQHTPDLFLVLEDGLLIEEWRDEKRLHRLAAERPEHFFKDTDGRWHYQPIESYLEPLGIEYRLRSADEHPVTFLSNMELLKDFTLETVPPIPGDELVRLKALLREHHRLEHQILVKEMGFKAEHVFQAVLQSEVFVDLYNTPIREFEELVIYTSEYVARADELLNRKEKEDIEAIASAMALAPGARFSYDGVGYEILIVGGSEISVKNEQGVASRLPINLVRELFEAEQIKQQGRTNLRPAPGRPDANEILSTRGLSVAVAKIAAINSPGGNTSFSTRTIQRAKQKTAGLSFAQDQLIALAPAYKGNTTSRLPDEVNQLAIEVITNLHNTPECPTIQATFDRFVLKCDEQGIRPMARSAFYRFIKTRSSIRDREGRRKEYQKTPINDYLDYGHPVHGVLPHEVCYCDHTIMNILLKGMHEKNLGKPTLTLMVDGALSMPRAFFLSFQPAGTHTVMMCLRDYVRRHGRLPRVLVLDNGKEFHSHALQLFCSTFNITIRWRRRSRPRDSSIIERAIGASETEVIAQLKGNTIALKDPREVSTTHHPEQFIEWTLPALHGALNSYFFEVQPVRIHPRFGVSPIEEETRINSLAGARGHLLVKYDSVFKLLTAPTSGSEIRKLDSIRGVFVDGAYHWNKEFIGLKAGAEIKVRIEPWNAEIVYVNINDKWRVAKARNAASLHGRYRYEVDIQFREERRRRKAEAQKDKSAVASLRKKTALWTPTDWDPRLREQLVESYVLYSKLGMTEVLPDGVNELADRIEDELPSGSRSQFFPVNEHELAPVSDVEPTASQGSSLPNASKPTLVFEPPLSPDVLSDDYGTF